MLRVSRLCSCELPETTLPMVYGTLTMEQLCLDGKKATMTGFSGLPPIHCPSGSAGSGIHP